MSLERLYYNDPFSNIVISCDLHCAENVEVLKRSLTTTIKSFESLGVSISIAPSGELRYCNIGHEMNLKNISFSDQDEIYIFKSLARHPFDLYNGETLKTIIQTKEFGYTLFFCMHHIIGDANSLILLLKRFIKQMQCSNTSVIESINLQQKQHIELDLQAKYLINTINKRYPGKQYSRNDYMSMHNHVHNNDLEVSKIILNKYEFRELKELCKKYGVSITSYIVSELFKVQNVELICLPVDSRRTGNTFGNYVGRIDISRSAIEHQNVSQNQVTIINDCIKSLLKDMANIYKGEEILSLIHPGFYDDVIFSRYSDVPNVFAQKMSKLIGYKDDTPTIFVSNLKSIVFDCEKKLKITNLCFYPPHPIERCSTIGIVTHNDQMIITIQKFRKGKKNEK